MEERRLTMTFKTTHTRAVVGNDLSITITAADKESIASVTITFDGEILEEEEFSDGTESYTRNFSGVGDAGPGTQHSLVVSATDQSGAPHSATTEWSDVS
jgi:hypothetical protein